MHLLAATEVSTDQAEEPVDLGQSSATLVFLSSADSDLACMAYAAQDFSEVLSVRLANWRYLIHPFSVDLYCDKVLSQTKWVIVRLLGGQSYWPYGVERLRHWAQEHAANLVFLSGDGQHDPALQQASKVDAQDYALLEAYCREGGRTNAAHLLRLIQNRLSPQAQQNYEPPPAQTLPVCGLIAPDDNTLITSEALKQAYPKTMQATAMMLFYRALVQAGDLDLIRALRHALQAHNIRLIPVFAASLKKAEIIVQVQDIIQKIQPEIVLNATGFALCPPNSNTDDAHDYLAKTALAGLTCPILQLLLDSQTYTHWQQSTQGLSSSDLAMQIALPELDGKLTTRAVSHKGIVLEAPWAEYQVIGHVPDPERLDFVAQLAKKWLDLAQTEASQRRVAILLAHYPNRNSRLGNGVGLDTPQSIIVCLEAMRQQGYTLPALPFHDGDGLINMLKSGPTNVNPTALQGLVRETLSAIDYQRHLASLPISLQQAIAARWGHYSEDAFFLDDQQAFALPCLRLGNICLGLQPARGYHIDPQASYHDPALVPPHGYFAFYAWLRYHFAAHALVQFGKHGNAEWLPGKAMALSSACYPEAMIGPTPLIYPFIVNDPGEGTQAKRRNSAVIIDHLMPAITRAGNEGELGRLELLVDEYYQASQTDSRRLPPLREEILAIIHHLNIGHECGISSDDAENEKLAKLDGYLCELKEWQIRDGLHVFGRLANAERRAHLLVSLLRLPRGEAAAQRSILQALAQDFALDPRFDPLALEAFSTPYTSPLPKALQQLDPAPIRHHGHVRERLEIYAMAMIDQQQPCPGKHSKAVMQCVQETLLPLLQKSCDEEVRQFLRALDGCYVPAGAAGAPTRNRWDVLPTGRNFFSLDSRTLPTAAAWKIGWKSAETLLERHAQDHGEYPKTLVMSAWGTANMRTGGDDIAQLMAFIGVEPTWQPATGRVTGFRIIPITVLARPRIDVTLRISGFFRDAFPAQIALLDQAIRAVATLEDETAAQNPLAANTRAETQALLAQGHTAETALHRAATRVFGAQPESYGAGLQALMDQGEWENRNELSEAFIRWGSFRYGVKDQGVEDQQALRQRLALAEVVSHNQDNREHDILDSDDYYQFQGGLTAAVASLSGKEPVVYHNDHSQPDAPKTRLLSEEIARVVRARVCNPKWQQSVMQHGYKGGFEMAAAVDYLFSYAATTQQVDSALFDAVARNYLDNDAVIAFLEQHNPDALTDIASRLDEALERNLWHPKHNHHRAKIQQIVEQHQRIRNNDTTM